MNSVFVLATFGNHECPSLIHGVFLSEYTAISAGEDIARIECFIPTDIAKFCGLRFNSEVYKIVHDTLRSAWSLRGDGQYPFLLVFKTNILDGVDAQSDAAEWGVATAAK